MPNRVLLPLGKNPRLDDKRNLKFARYVSIDAPTPPDDCSYIDGIGDWGMMLNGPNTYGNLIPPDGLGNCTCAGACHYLQAVSATSNKEVKETDAIVLALYMKWCGYVLGDPSTDEGGVLLDILKNWRKDGIDGHKLLAFAQIHLPSYNNKVIVSPAEIKRAIWMFGGAYVGVQLPVSAQNQDVWDVVSGQDSTPGSWGGHCIYLVAYDKDYVYAVTWGTVQKMTWAWFAKYCDEAYACVLQDWFKITGVNPQGLDMAQLIADLTYVTA